MPYIPFQDGDHSFVGTFLRGNVFEKVRMCEEVGVHFQQGATFENECGESDFGEVHTDAHLEMDQIQI